MRRQGRPKFLYLIEEYAPGLGWRLLFIDTKAKHARSTMRIRRKVNIRARCTLYRRSFRETNV